MLYVSQQLAMHFMSRTDFTTANTTANANTTASPPLTKWPRTRTFTKHRPAGFAAGKKEIMVASAVDLGSILRQSCRELCIIHWAWVKRGGRGKGVSAQIFTLKCFVGREPINYPSSSSCYGTSYKVMLRKRGGMASSVSILHSAPTSFAWYLCAVTKTDSPLLVEGWTERRDNGSVVCGALSPIRSVP